MFHQTLVQYATLHDRASVREVANQARHWVINKAGDNHAKAQRVIRTHSNQEHSYHEPQRGLTIKALNFDNRAGFNVWYFSVREHPTGDPLPRLQAIFMVQMYGTNLLPDVDACGSFTGLIEIRDPYDAEYTHGIVNSVKAFLDDAAPTPPTVQPDPEGKTIYSLADLLRNHAMLLVAPWQPNREPLPEAVEAAKRHSEIIQTAVIDHGTHRAISRELTSSEDLATWTHSDLILLTRPDNADPRAYALVDVPTTPEGSDAVVYRYVRNMKECMNFYIAQELMHLMMAVSTGQANMITSNTLQPITTEPAEHQIATLRNRVQELQSKLDAERQLNDTLSRQIADAAGQPHEENAPDPGANEADAPSPETAQDFADRFAQQAESWPHITVMDSFYECLPEQPPPEDADDFIAAVDSIHRIASALNNTPNRKIGSWARFFNSQPHWHYNAKESQATIARHGERRDFSHQDAVYRISRHISRNSQSTPAQIFFDVDHTQERQIMLAYLGPPLPSDEA